MRAHTQGVFELDGSLHEVVQLLRRFAWMLLLPLVAVLTVWGMGEVASYFAVGGEQYVFDAEASGQFLLSLAPLAAYVFVPILARASWNGWMKTTAQSTSH